MDVTGRCCARCKSPYGHVEAAGRCCHPITTLTALEQMLAAAREDAAFAEIVRAAKARFFAEHPEPDDAGREETR